MAGGYPGGLHDDAFEIDPFAYLLEDYPFAAYFPLEPVPVPPLPAGGGGIGFARPRPRPWTQLRITYAQLGLRGGVLVRWVAGMWVPALEGAEVVLLVGGSRIWTPLAVLVDEDDLTVLIGV
jgi:hypothetical protein